MYPVMTHVGRSSGRLYRVPLDAYPVDGGYLFILMYGSDSDWVKNVLAAGRCSLTIDANEFQLVRPRVVTEEVEFELLPATAKPPAGFLHVTEYLRMDTVR